MEDVTGIKSRLDILIGFRNTALAQRIENEINVRVIQRAMIVIKPGDEYEKMGKSLAQKKMNLENIQKAIDVMEEMIKEETNAKKISPN